MRYLFIVLFSLVLNSAFAHNYEHSLGTQADEIKASGKTYHHSVSMIRKMHPEFLIHKRDKTLRQGIRTKEHSLKGCVSCHANKNQQSNQYYPINQQGQFCAGCHAQVGVSVDCFNCHRTTPNKELK